MKRSLALIFTLLIFSPQCKDPDNHSVSGTATITNDLFGNGPYYAYGFSFSLGEKVSTLSTPGPDITVEANQLNGEPFLSANTFDPAFSLYDEYTSEDDAREGFDNLASVGTVQWIAMGTPLKDNQVWIIRTEEDKYAKIRTIKVITNAGVSPPFASLEFEWVFQPDGTKIFP